MTSHANCHHPKTKEARAACRQASKVFETTPDKEWIQNTETDDTYADKAWDPADHADSWVIEYRDEKRNFWRTHLESIDRGEAMYGLWDFVTKNPGRAVRIVEPINGWEDD